MDLKLRRWAGVLFVGGGISGCQQQSSEVSIDSYAAALKETKDFTLRVDLPPNVRIQDLALGASDSLRVGDGVRIIEPNGTGAKISNLGDDRTEIEEHAVVGSTWSASDILIESAATVDGNVATGGTLLSSHHRGTITGTTSEHANLAPGDLLTWEVTFPPTSAGDRRVKTHQTLVPGAYGNVTVEDHGSVTLQSGTYFLTSLEVHQHASLHIDHANGPTIVYVLSSVNSEGNWVDSSANAGQTLLAYLGQRPVAIAGSFIGTFIAPRARLQLGRDHDSRGNDHDSHGSDHDSRGNDHDSHGSDNGTQETGAFFAREIAVEDKTSILHRPFEAWDGINPFVRVAPGCLDVRLFALKAKTPSPSKDADEGLTGVAEFMVPKRLVVRIGNAGTGLASLIFRRGERDRTTCEYKGGASRPHPTTTADIEKGLFYNLVRCGQDDHPNRTITADRLQLHVESGDSLGDDAGETAVAVNVIEAAPCDSHVQPQRALPPVEARVSSPARLNLSPSTIDDFIGWIARISVTQDEIVGEQIDAVKPASFDLIQALVAKLNGNDLTPENKLVVLAILGHLRSALAADDLVTFVWQPLPQGPPPVEHGPRPGHSFAKLEAAAVQALAHIDNERALATVLYTAGNHPSKVVRSAAADAYLFAFGDSDAAKSALASIVRPGEDRFVYRVRKTADSDPVQFSRAVREYYDRFPQDRAP